MRLAAALCLCWAAMAAEAVQTYPESRVDDTVDVIHGTRVPDPYRWLEEQDSPGTRAWIDAQNAHTRAYLDGRPVRPRIAARIAELTRVDSVFVPKVRSGVFFYRKRLAAQNQSDIYMRGGSGGREQVLVDANAMSRDGSRSVALIEVSSDAKLMAYGVRTGGRDEMVLRIMDVASRRDLPDEFPEARYFGVVFDTRRNGFYYCTFTAKGPRLRYHRLGAPVADDREVFGSGLGPQLGLTVHSAPGSRHLLVTVWYGSASKSDLYLKEIASDAKPAPVVTNVDALFFGSLDSRRIFVRTTWEAPNKRVMVADLDKPERQHWSEFVPESERVLEQFVPAGDTAIAVYSEAAVEKVEVLDANGKRIRTAPLPALGIVSPVEATTGDSPVWFAFTSFAYPQQIYEYHPGTGRLAAWHISHVPLKSDDFAVDQVWYESKDRTRVPMFLAYRKGLRPDGETPVLLTAYGGFSITMGPSFNPSQIVWMEAGGILAAPALRGGGEFGEKWHQAGMLERKQNVFDDCIAAIEWLIAKKYTTPSKVAIRGGSNGGLLVGAMATQRPDLFQAAICGAPLLDMVRYHKFLVARWWIPEYGSSDDPKQFEYLLRYSPYHNVKKGVEYPAMLFVTGDSDTRVHPLHARKMTALMQAATASDGPILLLYDTGTGHSGGKPADRMIADRDDELAFLFSQVGMDYKPR